MSKIRGSGCACSPKVHTAFFFFRFLNRTASPVAAVCGCNEHGSLAAANRYFSYLPARNRWKLVTKIQASQSFGKCFLQRERAGRCRSHTPTCTRAHPVRCPKASGARKHVGWLWGQVQGGAQAVLRGACRGQRARFVVSPSLVFCFILAGWKWLLEGRTFWGAHPSQLQH